MLLIAIVLAKGRPAPPTEPLPDVLPWGEYTGNRLHPTQKPVEPLRTLIRAYAGHGHVLEPFCGSGSTAVAAIAEGCRFTAIDLDPEHFATARERLMAIPGNRPKPTLKLQSVPMPVLRSQAA